MQNRTFDSEYKIMLETNNILQTCIVAGNASSHIEEEHDGSIKVHLKTDKLLAQPGSSWSCPPSLGPLEIKGDIPSSSSSSFNATVSIHHPSLEVLPKFLSTIFSRFFSNEPIVRTVEIKTTQPIATEVKYAAGLDEKGELAKGSSVEADICVKKPHSNDPSRPSEPTLRKVRLSPDTQSEEKTKFHVELLGDLFKKIPLPFTTLTGSFERKLPEASKIQKNNSLVFFKNRPAYHPPLLFSSKDTPSEALCHHV